jgi:hypothetical protein
VSFGHLARSFAVAALAALAGCGGGGATDDRPRQEVSGTVTLDGQPLAAGSIQFQPSTAQDGVVAGALIADGKYSIPRDQGLVPGTYSVSISSVGSSAPPPGPPGPSGPPSQGPQDLVPSRYNAQSTLTIKVEPGNTKPFDFVLQK